VTDTQDYQQIVQLDEKLQTPHTPRDKREFVQDLVDAIEVRRKLIKPKAFRATKKLG
jgi:hypothetical protein